MSGRNPGLCNTSCEETQREVLGGKEGLLSTPVPVGEGAIGPECELRTKKVGLVLTRKVVNLPSHYLEHHPLLR